MDKKNKINDVKKYSKIGIDLGTANLLVYVDGEGIIFNEPSVIALEYSTNEVIAVGTNAARMIGRGHHGIKIVSPLNQGVISDMIAAKKLIEIAIKKAENTDINLSASTVLICCPSEVTQIERDSMVDLAKNLGVPDVFIEEEVKAGGIGAGLDVYSSNGSMVIDIGGGSTDIGVLSLGDIVVSESLRIAGNYFDNEIINYMQYKHGLLIGKRTAERIKEEIGSLRKVVDPSKNSYANGRDVVSGLPRKIQVTQEEVRDILLEPFESIVNSILKVLQKTPAELSADIIVNGMFVNGGGALIDGVDEYIKDKIGLEVHIAKNPLTAIVEGTKVLLQNRGNYFVKPVD
ncbi:rod shape-determining protein [Candidatus Izimaplasma bacterium ZiA1]|uniref:rod shape-determining protein n=1 Tax=Candidatus Izimoplasma sp. ZiA1 TaxID=2024899 RepID=UPI000BAA6A7F|nr:rod shape-determining protein [Candidatus Izimaplasma bacterium ZiA1]